MCWDLSIIPNALLLLRVFLRVCISPISSSYHIEYNKVDEAGRIDTLPMIRTGIITTWEAYMPISFLGLFGLTAFIVSRANAALADPEELGRQQHNAARYSLAAIRCSTKHGAPYGASVSYFGKKKPSEFLLRDLGVRTVDGVVVAFAWGTWLWLLIALQFGFKTHI